MNRLCATASAEKLEEAGTALIVKTLAEAKFTNLWQERLRQK
jgi:hypothetical protein